MACNNCQNTNQCPCQNQSTNPSCGCSKKQLLKEIMALNFAINDLALYLDTHPNDSSAIRLHSEYSQKQINLLIEMSNDNENNPQNAFNIGTVLNSDYSIFQIQQIILIMHILLYLNLLVG